jgi:hypothetical protein
MSVAVNTELGSSRDDAARNQDLRFLASPLLSVALIVIAIAQQASGHIDSDVSWFLTLAEKFLDGRFSPDDMVDPNPPIAILSLVPAFPLARLLHAPVEAVLVALVLVFALLSIGLCGYILRFGAARSALGRGLLLNGAIYLLLVTPALIFAQREHLALLAMAPMLAALAANRGEDGPPRVVRLLAGLGCAIAISFKPFFALAVVLPALAIAWRERSIRVFLTLEMLTAGAVSILLGLAVVVFFPVYSANVTAFGLDVYGVAHESLINFLAKTLAPYYVACAIGLLILARGVPRGIEARTAFLASLGFFLCFVLQRKGWINHAYPAMALLFLAWLAHALDLAREEPGAAHPLVRFFFVPLLIASPFCFGGGGQWADAEEHPGLLAAAASHAPPRPRVIALAFNCDVGHPLTRRLHGQWVGHPCSLWTTSYVDQLLNSSPSDPAYRARLAEYRRRDLTTFARDVDEGRADVIVVESPRLREWSARQPEIAGVLAPFEKTGDAGEIEVWTRRAN